MAYWMKHQVIYSDCKQIGMTVNEYEFMQPFGIRWLCWDGNRPSALYFSLSCAFSQYLLKIWKVEFSCAFMYLNVLFFILLVDTSSGRCNAEIPQFKIKVFVCFFTIIICLSMTMFVKVQMKAHFLSPRYCYALSFLGRQLSWHD